MMFILLLALGLPILLKFSRFVGVLLGLALGVVMAPVVFVVAYKKDQARRSMASARPGK